MSDAISLTDLRKFLLAYVTTYDELEVLLFLLDHAEVDVPLAQIALELGIEPLVCLVALEELSGRGLMARASDAQAFRFSPANEGLARDAAILAHAYRTSRHSVIRAMSENAVQRVRSSAAKAFPEVQGRRKPGE